MFARTEKIVCLISLCLISGCAENRNGTGAGLIGNAPSFSLPQYPTGTFDSAELKGKVAVIDFWATWCPGCQQSLPHLQMLDGDADRKAQGLEVVTIDEEEPSSLIKPFVEQNHFTFTILRDKDGSVGSQYKATTLPTTVVLGRDGKIRARFSGWTELSSQRLDEAITSALSATTQPSTAPSTQPD